MTINEQKLHLNVHTFAHVTKYIFHTVTHHFYMVGLIHFLRKQLSSAYSMGYRTKGRSYNWRKVRQGPVLVTSLHQGLWKAADVSALGAFMQVGDMERQGASVEQMVATLRYGAWVRIHRVQGTKRCCKT